MDTHRKGNRDRAIPTPSFHGVRMPQPKAASKLIMTREKTFTKFQKIFREAPIRI